MIVTGRIAVRIALIVVAAVILQVAFFSFLSVLGAAPNLVPVVVVCLGLLGGAVIGAVCGFAAGLLTDSVLLQTLGVSSLVLLSVGYLAGRYRESVEVIGRTTPALLAGALTLLAAAGFAAVQLMLGVETSVSVAVPSRGGRPGRARRPARARRLPARPPAARARPDRLLARAPHPAATAPSPASPFAPARRAERAPGWGARDPPAAPPRPGAPPTGPRGAGVIGPRGDWRGPPPSSQLAFRVAALGGLALVVFVVVFLRLWYLQVLSGDSYASEAQNNQVREFTVQAPRGEILDRDGRPMVQNRTALELQVETRELPRSGARRARLLARLGELTGMSPEQIRHQIRAQTRELPASPVTPAARRGLRRRLLPAREPGSLPRRLGRSASSSATTRRAASRRTCSATSARSARPSSRTRATTPSSRATSVGKDGRRVRPTTASCAGSTARPGCRSTPPGPRPRGRSRPASRGPATTSC